MTSLAAQAVSTRIHHSVGVLTFEAHARMNSFDPAALEAIGTALRDLLAQEEVRAVVMTGSGRAFSTGADVAAMQAAAAQGTASQWVLEATQRLHPLLVAMQASPKPIVAAVNGVAAGGGLGLALACDARIGSPAARFAAGYFGIGLCPDGGATWFLPRLIGWQRTRRFFFDNEVLQADEARNLGLLDQVVDADALLDEALALAARWGENSSHSTWATKRLLAATMDAGLAEQLDAERGMIAAAAAQKDFLEGTTAFVEKRTPRFG